MRVEKKTKLTPIEFIGTSHNSAATFIIFQLFHYSVQWLCKKELEQCPHFHIKGSEKP